MFRYAAQHPLADGKVLEALVKSGSFDFLGTSRKALFDQLDTTSDSAQRQKEEKEKGQNSLFGMSTNISVTNSIPLTVSATTMKVLLWWLNAMALEKWIMNIYL